MRLQHFLNLFLFYFYKSICAYTSENICLFGLFLNAALGKPCWRRKKHPGGTNCCYIRESSF